MSEGKIFAKNAPEGQFFAGMSKGQNYLQMVRSSVAS